MRWLIALILLTLAACSTAKRTDGVTPGEAEALNAAADKLDTTSPDAAR